MCGTQGGLVSGGNRVRSRSNNEWKKSAIITDLQATGLLEEILRKDNLNKAYKKVKSNKGSGGVDGMDVDELLLYLRKHGKELNQQICDGKYKRTLQNTLPYIENKLFLKVNRDKTCVAHISKVKYLGYAFYNHKGLRFRVHPKSVEKMKQKLRMSLTGYYLQVREN